MYRETSRLSPSSSEYSIHHTKSLRGHTNVGAIVVKSHTGWTLLRHWIHIAAVTVTGGLTAINILNIYLVDSDTPKLVTILNAFQFVAKLHEVLIVGSLMLVMMDTVRSKLISPAGVPLGYVLAPVLFNDLDWLTSHQFWSSIKPTRSSFTLTFLVVAAIPFANIAGPLSAITVVPRLGWSARQAAAVFPTFWNASSNTIWPDTLAAGDLIPACFTGAGQQAGCPGSAFKNVWVNYDPTYDKVLCTTVGPYVSCNTTIGSQDFRSLSVEYAVNSLTAFATTPTDVIFETIAGRFTDGVALSLDISDTKIIDAQKAELIETDFIGNGQMMKPVVQTTCEDLSYAQIYETFGDSKVSTNWSMPTVHWIGDIDDSATPNFLFTYLKNDSSLNAALGCKEQDCYAATRCTTNAKWVPMAIWYNSAQAGLVYGSDPQPRRLFESASAKAIPSVIIKRGWLEAFNVPTAIDVSKVLSGFMNDWNVRMSGAPQEISTSGFQARPNPSNYSQAISILVSSFVTEGMSRNSLRIGDSLYSGNCTDRKPGFKFATEICDSEPSHWVHTDTLGDLRDNFSMMTFSVRRSGYGWFIDSLTVKIALGILLFHAFLTLFYLIFTLAFRRQITTCWSSAPEMLMLAVDSLRAPVLMGSSAKASHRDLWRELVSVMEVDGGERVSLIVGDHASYPNRLGGPPVLGKKYN